LVLRSSGSGITVDVFIFAALGLCEKIFAQRRKAAKGTRFLYLVLRVSGIGILVGLHLLRVFAALREYSFNAQSRKEDTDSTVSSTQMSDPISFHDRITKTNCGKGMY
jgi:hypothetical protein